MLTNQILSKTFQTVKDSVSDSFRLPSDQIPRVFFHGVILAWIIAAFWLLDSLKDPILVDTVGIEYQPYAKFSSVITTLVVVCIYDYLTSVVSKHTLFHIISGAFGTHMLVLAGLLSDPTIGLPNKNIGELKKVCECHLGN